MATNHVHVKDLDGKAVVVLPQDTDCFLVDERVACICTNAPKASSRTPLKFGYEEGSIGAIFLVHSLPVLRPSNLGPDVRMCAYYTIRRQIQ